MLEFYKIADSENRNNQNHLKDSMFAGEIEHDVFNRLVKKGIIDKRFDYFTDFRWGSDVIKQIKNKLTNFENDSDIIILARIVNVIKEDDYGLIGYCD
ncbi:hypothetical protein [Mangrovivirga cuniculi]|uniref:Uncharacterized protein n=1 Tax=Mangrovivirga cuniculi TaxID=2715131 RepID=A0A4D7JUE9_9BACT|nr:hypothetical protein [Mangrovivirga cuniculi]QCK15806.1 hypothetical protein DCC35_14150 [Mangrovivirga cuniculi]